MTAAVNSRPSRFSGTSGVWMLTAVLAAVASAFALAMAGVGPLIPGTVLRGWMLIPVFVLVEIFVVHIDSQREAQTISLSEVALVVGLFLVPPVELIAAQIIGGGLALAVYRRQSAVKVAFNVAQFAVGTSIAIGLFRLLVGEFDPTAPIAWLMGAIALLVADLATALLLSFVIRIVDGKRATPTIRYFIGFGTICTLANTALGLLGVALLRRDPQAGLLLIVPIGVTVAAYRGYWREHRRNETLEFLYDSMRRLGSATDLEKGLRDFLTDARTAFHANLAAVVLNPVDPDDLPRRLRVGNGSDDEALTEIDAHLIETSSREPFVAARRGGGAYWCRLLDRNVNDAMVIALEGDGRTVGTLVVADRASSINTFTRSDLQFLRTFAGHAGVTLENRHLARSVGELSRENDELFQRALHDPLTRLANRSYFHERVEDALAGSDTEALVGVLYIDLDDFKTINDTLGHAAGDRVLMAVAERIRACLRPGDMAARLGGDEFAVLLCDLVRESEADAICERILGALRAPVAAGEEEVMVRASVGMAVQSVGGLPSDLINHADSAMYDAKRAGKGRWVAHAAPQE